MEKVSSVRTSLGLMKLEAEKLIIEESVRSHIRNLYLSFWKEGDSYHKVLLVNLVIALATSLTAVFVATATNPLFYIVMAATVPTGFASVVIFREFFTKVTDENEIEAENIHYVKIKQGNQIISEPKAIIYYEDEKHRDKIRKLNLPPLLAPKSDEFIKDAVHMFEDAGIKVK
jgi:hypothetical protein